MKKFFQGIEHPAIAAANVRTLADWYVRVLGYVEYFKREDGQVILLQAPDQTLLEIMSANDSPRQNRLVADPGFSHLALKVSDLEQAIIALDQHKVEWLNDITEAAGGGKLRNLADLEGNVIQIVKR